MSPVSIGSRAQAFYGRAKMEVVRYRQVAQHPRTPRLARWCLGLAMAYLVTPLDLIPDFIPVLGHLDDLVIVPALILTARALIPADVWRECRADQNVAQ
jgi:uncharacterized membrane protein YkvA (DUF1232 family)